MLSTLLLISLAVAQLPFDDVPTVPYSIISSTGCDSNCNLCWEAKGLFNAQICADCKDGYFFNPEKRDTKCYSATDFNNGRGIPGYKRECAQCGLHNYLDSNFDCQSCPVHCDECYQSKDGACSKCYASTSSSAGVFDKFSLESGQCICKDGKIRDGLCKCNDALHFINETDDYKCQECYECSRNYAKCPNIIPLHHWDNDTEDCPMVCHDSCSECNSYARNDCKNKTANGIPFCRNEYGWEEVHLYENQPLECFCVCHANEKEDFSKNIHDEFRIVCECQENRELIDTCTDRNCTDAEKLYKMQCVCKNGYVDGEKDAAGFVPCIKSPLS